MTKIVTQNGKVVLVQIGRSFYTLHKKLTVKDTRELNYQLLKANFEVWIY